MNPRFLAWPLLVCRCIDLLASSTSYNLKSVGYALLSVAVDLGDVGEEVEHTARVAPLVVVPGDELDEVVVEGDTGLAVDDRAVGVAVQVARDDIVVGVVEDAWEM